MNFLVTKNGKPLDNSLYSWDKDTRTFSSKEENLTLNFYDIDFITFNTEACCTFNTGSNCVFNTDSCCTFNTGADCVFNTKSCCVFNTGSNCIFNTNIGCVFNTKSYCIFNIFDSCEVNTGLNSVVVRKDIFEVIVLDKKENHIKLNSHFNKGYKVIKNKHIITIDGKDIELSEQRYNSLKEQLK